MILFQKQIFEFRSSPIAAFGLEKNNILENIEL
jgi:hypothetical protein